MKNFISLVLLVIIATAIAHPATALGAGWWQETTSDPIGEGYWLDQIDNAGLPSPHGNYSSTTNLCKTCHAVHLAGADSYRLLKSGTTTETRSQGELEGENGMGNKRSTECMYCHDATSGASDKRPYGVIIQQMSATVRGEHTLGATWIPDSSVNDSSTPDDDKGKLFDRNPLTYNGRGAELDCYQCHSVHGAKILTDITAFGWGVSTEPIDNYILRIDPAGNGGDANLGIGQIDPPPSGWQNGQPKADPNYPTTDAVPYDPYGEWKFEVMNAWCGDCHNLNPNITAPNDIRPNKRSHPLFGGSSTETTEPFTGGRMEIYGLSEQKVSGGAPKGCDGCHMSGQMIAGQTVMSWPHQAEGNKFLIYTTGPMMWENFTEGIVTTGTGDSGRPLEQMDKVCLWCHRYESTEGVGLTY